jgi:Na+/melibiose symporter-like transporter
MASGALAGGWLVQVMQNGGATPLDSYRSIIIGYALFGIMLVVLFLGLTQKVEVKVTEPDGIKRQFGLHRSKRTVLKLSALFSLDAFGGDFIVRSILTYWFYVGFGTDAGTLGTIFFAANILAGFSALAAVRIAKRIGLIRTMVYTHVPSNILLILIAGARPDDGHGAPAAPVQHISDGRVDPSVLRHFRRERGREVGRLGHHRRRPDRRLRDGTFPGGLSAQ